MPTTVGSSVAKSTRRRLQQLQVPRYVRWAAFFEGVRDCLRAASSTGAVGNSALRGSPDDMGLDHHSPSSRRIASWWRALSRNLSLAIPPASRERCPPVPGSLRQHKSRASELPSTQGRERTSPLAVRPLVSSGAVPPRAFHRWRRPEPPVRKPASWRIFSGCIVVRLTRVGPGGRMEPRLLV